MYCMLTTDDVSHAEMSLLKEPAPKNICPILVTDETSQVDKLPLKAGSWFSANRLRVSENMLRIFMTDDVFHAEMSSLKVAFPENKLDMSLMLPTHQTEIGHP